MQYDDEDDEGVERVSVRYWYIPRQDASVWDAVVSYIRPPGECYGNRPRLARFYSDPTRPCIIVERQQYNS